MYKQKVDLIMKKRIAIYSSFILIIFTVLCLSSCATTLRVNVTRPSNLNLNGAKSIAVLPFEKGNHSPFDYIFENEDDEDFDYWEYYNLIENTEEQFLRYIKNRLDEEISKSSYIELVSNVPVENALKYGKKLPCDALISGEVVTFKVHDLTSKEKKPIPENADSESVVNGNIIESTPAEGNGFIPLPDSKPKPEFYYKYTYTREVQFIFNYEIVDAETKELLGYDTVKIENISDPVEKKDLLPTVYNMVVGDLDSFISSLMRDIQPFTETKSITLLEDNTKNPLMENANKLAKDGNYSAAYKAFMDVYNSNNQFEAGYNAAMILIAMNELESARSLMESIRRWTSRR